MKKHFTFLFLAFFIPSFFATSQTLLDTKDYIIEKIEANPPLSNTTNRIWFNDNISLDFLSGVLGFQATQDYLTAGTIIFCRTQYSESNKSNYLFAIYYTFDIASVSKISVTPNTTIKDRTAYNLNVYLIEEPPAVKFVEYTTGEKKYELGFGRKIDIIVGCDESLAKKLKSAFIHFGSLFNVTINDGDVF